ncbi:MAG: TetR/AcrR family transcriptional regulator [Elusimicrobia bacterium]|nr:TetR/AcrR family transcriptional regulator [Elusimicrobiota bacterium]
MTPTITHARTDARRASILEAARRLLIRRGYQNFVLDDLAREAGVAKGTLFLYFKTKDELISATFGDLIDQLAVQLDGLKDSGLAGEKLLEETVHVILAHLDRNSDFMSQFSAGRFPGCGDKSCGKLMEKMGENVSRLSGLLKAAQTKESRFDHSGPSAVSLFGLCRSALLYKKLTGSEGAVENRARWVLERFLYGACGRKR